MQGGQGSYIILSKNQFGLDDLFGTIADVVHLPHPFHLISSFQGFGHTLGFLHLLNDQSKLFFSLFVQLDKIAAQFTGQNKLIVADRVVIFQIVLM